MKVLAIIDLVPKTDGAAIAQHLDDELRAAWRLYADNIIRECHATDSPGRVVFVLEVADMAKADDVLHRLPMISLGLFSVQLMELRPFANWRRLFA